MDYMDKSKYLSTLTMIDSELHEIDIKNMKFLCQPSIQRKHFSDVTSGLSVFEALEKSGLLSEADLSFLTELLLVIGRVDLAYELNYDGTDIDASPEEPQIRKVCPFRVLLFQISEDLAKEDLDSLRFLYQKVPKKAVIEEGIDLFSIMLQHRAVTESDTSLLTNFMEHIKRKDLAEKIRLFTGKGHHVAELKLIPEGVGESTSFSSGEGNSFHMEDKSIPMDESPPPSEEQNQSEDVYNLYSPEDNLDHMSDMMRSVSLRSRPDQASYLLSSENESNHPPPEDHSDHMNYQASYLRSSGNHIAQAPQEPVNALQMSLGEIFDSLPSLECYKMDANPRGKCIIINNWRFQFDPRDRDAVALSNREGSDVDRESLVHSFFKLNFIVDIWENLTSQEMHEKLKRLSLENHQEYDCFVCCMLSHGGNGFVFGTNGHKVNISDMTGYFRAQSCPTLAGKPKLFFIACCRGKVHQEGVNAHNPQIQDYETDSDERPHAELVANEADFLLGYATVSNYVSYRSKSRGTFYINELTSVLDTYAHREDIHTLLTLVNKRVSERHYKPDETNIYKQIPAPQHTLRKTLKFF